MVRWLLAAGVCFMAGAALAQDAPVTITLDSGAKASVPTVNYSCEGSEEPLPVQYINAGPNSVAILPVEGQSLLFVTTISGSGARYVSGRYEWWSKGEEGTLRDLTAAENAAPMAECREAHGQ